MPPLYKYLDISSFQSQAYLVSTPVNALPSETRAMALEDIYKINDIEIHNKIFLTLEDPTAYAHTILSRKEIFNTALIINERIMKLVLRLVDLGTERENTQETNKGYKSMAFSDWDYTVQMDGQRKLSLAACNIRNRDDEAFKYLFDWNSYCTLWRCSQTAGCVARIIYRRSRMLLVIHPRPGLQALVPVLETWYWKVGEIRSDLSHFDDYWRLVVMICPPDKLQLRSTHPEARRALNSLKSHKIAWCAEPTGRMILTLLIFPEIHLR